MGACVCARARGRERERERAGDELELRTRRKSPHAAKRRSKRNQEKINIPKERYIGVLVKLVINPELLFDLTVDSSTDNVITFKKSESYMIWPPT
jgi:hypothetical protein